MRHKGRRHDQTVARPRLPNGVAPKRRRIRFTRTQKRQQKLTTEQFAPKERGTRPALQLRIRRAHGGHRQEQGRTPMANAIDLHVGKRLRRRRRLLGLTQQQLAESIGIRFQQIQKYECGANRVTASRLYELAVALNVPVNYFFEGLQQVAAPATPGAPANDRDLIAADVLSQKETLELIRAYYKLGERPRRRLLDLAKALQDESTDAA